MSPNTKPTKPVDIYIRVSEVGGREGDSYISPGVQEERCRAMLSASGLVAGEVFTDEDETGRKMDRPAFNKALQRALDGTSGGIVVWKLSRFGRNTEAVLAGIRQLEEAGAVLLSCEENLDTSNHMGKFFVTIIAALAEMESEQIKAGWATAQKQAVGRGVKVSRTPIGYLRADGGQLVPDEAVAPFITEAFERRAQGETYESIAVWLDEAGVEKPVRRERNEDGVLVEADPVPWDYRQVMDLLSREVYLGHVVLGDLRSENAHPALVDEETWLRVRARNGKPATKATTSAKGTHLLTGYIRCAGCGKAMAYSKSAPRGKVYFFCRCKRSSCTEKAGIAPVELEAYVANVLAQAVAVEIVKPRRNEERLAAARARRDRAEAELADFESTWQEQGIGASAAAKVIGSLELALEEAEQAITEIPNDEVEDATWAQLRQQLKDSSSEVVVQLLRDRPVVFPGMLPSVSEDEIEQLVEGAKERTEQLVETGLAGTDLLEALLLPVAKLRQDAPELAEQLFQTKRLILKRFLSKVTVSGKGGPAEGRVDVELKA